jgi:hypothetical protein
MLLGTLSSGLDLGFLPSYNAVHYFFFSAKVVSLSGVRPFSYFFFSARPVLGLPSVPMGLLHNTYPAKILSPPRVPTGAEVEE